MSRFAGLRDWPVSARVAAGVLSALVAVFALTTFLAANHRKTQLRAAGPTPTTTSTVPTADTAFLTTTPSSTASSTTSTTPAKAGGSTTQGPTTASPAQGGAVTATVIRPAPTPTTQPGPTTTVVSGAFCRASAAQPTPAAGSNETVDVSSTLPDKEVTLVVHYRTGDVTFPAQGKPAFMTDSGGRVAVTFSVSQGSKDYPVIVDVAIGGGAATCETNFRPSS